ncbi:MAG: 3-methyl-2-oxobutanoate hydroxymethyltransferase, partial [Coriobacteriales bacterium]|nr:3-methyl-2-oxobutanoate hydroxymethyltransferase [Coriobacteriales bacterium]
YGGTTAKFVKQFADAGKVMREGFASYIEEVKNGSFPAQEYCYKIEPEALAEAKRRAGE